MSHHLVLGATGNTGRRIVPRLRLRGVPVRAASRSGETRFDWSDPAGWDDVLRDVAVAYLVPPRDPAPVGDFLARAEAAGVRHLVLLSGRGADLWGDSTFGLDMRAAETAVRGSTLDWTVLRASNFAQNFDDENLFRGPLVAGELALPSESAPEPFVDLEDVADAATELLADPAPHTGRTYELTGPRSLTWREATELIARASGRRIDYRTVPAEAYAAMLVEAGAGQEDASDVAAMFVLLERGLQTEPTDDATTLLGRPARPFEEYVVRAAAAGTWRP